jgi:hypothetical protein
MPAPGLSGWRSKSVEILVNLALYSAAPRKAVHLDLESLRILIRSKLEQGLLPYNHIPRIWGAPGAGETCDGCDLVIEPPEMVMEGITLTDGGTAALRGGDRRRPLQLHVLCFYVWDEARRS